MSNYFPMDPNVTSLATVHDIQVLPRRRMKFADRAAYDAWERWYLDAFIDAVELGYPAAARMFATVGERLGISEPITLFNAQRMLGLLASGFDVAFDLGARLALLRGKTFRQVAPPLPRVWPGPRNPDVVADTLRQDAILRFGLREQAAA